MEFLEKDLEDVIYEAYTSGKQNFLQERGLSCFSHDYIIRQLNLGDYGIADLIAIDFIPYLEEKGKSFFIVTIYELKKDAINMATFSQIIKYGKAITSFLRSQGMYEGWILKYVIVGRSISQNSDNLCFMSDIFRTIKTYTYDYSFDGIRFKPTKDYVCGTGNTGTFLKLKKKEFFKLFLLKKRGMEEYEKEQEEIESDKSIQEYFETKSLSTDS